MKKSIALLALVALMVGCNDNSSNNTQSGGEESMNATETVLLDSSVNETISASEDIGTLTIPLQTVREGYSKQITPRFSNPNSVEPIEYVSTNDAVVTIDENGVITGLKTGSVKVNYVSEHFDGSFYVTVTSDSRFASKVSAREKAYDNADYPEENRTLFAGDSFMDTEFWSNFYSSYYRNYNAYTMGISATQAADWYYYCQKLLIPYNPQNIVFHIGTNDINDAGCSGKQAYENIKDMVDLIHAELPETMIYLMGIEPSISFAANFNKEIAANDLIKTYCTSNSSWLTYVDTPSRFMNADKTAADGTKLRDGLHPKLENYSLIVEALEEAGLEVAKLPNAPEEEKHSWVALNSSTTSYITYEENETKITLDCNATGQNATPNRVFYSKDGKNMYKDDIALTGKISYSEVKGSNYFAELNFSPTSGDWSTSNTFQFLLWNNNGTVFNNNSGYSNGQKSVSSGTEYEFTAITKDKTVYFKFSDVWFKKSVGSDVGFSISGENLKVTCSSLQVKTDSSEIASMIPETVNYTI